MDKNDIESLATEAMTINVRKGVSRDFGDWCERKMMVKKQVISALVEWFMNQPESIRTIVIGTEDRDMAQHHIDLLLRLVEEARRRKVGK